MPTSNLSACSGPTSTTLPRISSPDLALRAVSNWPGATFSTTRISAVRIDHGSAGFLREPLPIQAVAADNSLHREHDALAAALLHVLMLADRSGTQRYLLVTIFAGMRRSLLDYSWEQFGSQRAKKGRQDERNSRIPKTKQTMQVGRPPEARSFFGNASRACDPSNFRQQ